MLEAVHEVAPSIYNFCHLSYSEPTILSFQGHQVGSCEGNQQGDPLGPLQYAVTSQPILDAIESELVLGYLDDLTLGGAANVLVADMERVVSLAGGLGLVLNTAKCEIISCSGFESVPDVFLGFRHLSRGECELLGSPLLVGPAMDYLLAAKCDNLDRAVGRLPLLSAHDSLLILKNSLSSPKLLYTLRTSPCVGHPGLDRFDAALRKALASVSNVVITDLGWVQASLPVGNGGLGIRSVAMLAPSAFLASAAATLGL